MVRRILPICTALALGLFAVGCERETTDVYGMEAAVDMPPLYERMGGERTIRSIVDETIARAARDPRINYTRQGEARTWLPSDANVERLREGYVRYFSRLAGGPQVYDGPSLGTVHAGMNISGTEFDAFLDDVRQSLAALNLPENQRHEFMALLATTRPDIVQPRRSATEPSASGLPRLPDFSGRESSAPGEGF